MMSTECKLTTFDNPFDPFEQFASWFLFDEEKGYHSCSVLARIAKISSDMSEEEYHSEIERAIDEIIIHDFTNTFKKVSRQVKDDDSDDTDLAS